MDSNGGELQLLVRVFRRESHRVFPSERTTVLGADDMLMVLQLAMAEVNKQGCGEFTVSLSDVLMVWKHFLLDKLQLPPLAAAARPQRYDAILEVYRGFLKASNSVDLPDVLLMYKQLRVYSDPEEPLGPIGLLDFLSGNSSQTESPRRSKVVWSVRRVFCSYLSLLVNSMDDLSLARVLDVPSRSLGHDAFTHIKHAARNANTSMFLALSSFVRALELGGKGYAPSDVDPLRKHLKGLTHFLHFMDHLQEILGDTPEPSECGAQLLGAIRAALQRGRCRGDEVHAAAEETSRELEEKMRELWQKNKETTNVSNTGISPARPKLHAVNHATAFGGRDTVKLLLALLDEEATTPPCANKAELLLAGQPTACGAERTCILTLFRSPEVSSGTSPEPLKRRVQSRVDRLRPKPSARVIRSQFACTYRDDDDTPLKRVLDFPSSSGSCEDAACKPQATPTTVGDSSCTDVTAVSGRVVCEAGAALKPRSVNAGRGVQAGGETAGKSNKRKQADGDDAENQAPERKRLARVSVRAPKSNVGKASGKRKLIPGQGKLTGFFRV